MGLENIILNEVTQIQRDKHVLSLICDPSSKSLDLSVFHEVTTEARKVKRYTVRVGDR